MNTTTFLAWTVHATFAAFGDIAPGRRRSGEQESKPIGNARNDRRRTRDRPRRQRSATATTRGRSARSGAHRIGRTPFTDYHTVQTPKKRGKVREASRKAELEGGPLHTVITHREWRAGSMFTVIVWSKTERTRTMGEIEQALLLPQRMLYVGRKAGSLALPLRMQVIEAETFVKAFEQRTLNATEAWVIRAWGEPTPSVREITCDADAPGAPTHGRTEMRRDIALNRALWQFGERETRTFNETPTQR